MNKTGERVEEGKRVWLNSKDEETYNSDVIKSFIWRDMGDNEDYERGQLIVSFKGSSVYTYNVPFTVYEEMAKRAYKPQDFLKTPFQWYDNNMIDWVTTEKANESTLYVRKLDK